MKKVNVLFLVLFAACLAIPLVCFNFEKDSVSEIDNKVLTELDADQGITLEDLTDYINDRIGLRDEALNAYQVLNDRLFHEMEHPTYCYGQDGYVFLKLEENTVDEEFIAAFCEYLSRVQTYCRDRGVPFIYCVTPSKTTVYSQYLPQGYIYDNQFLACLYENLDRCGINYVDNAAYLTEVAAGEQIFNKQYDAGHWNDLGEFYGMNHILEEVHRYFPSVQLLELSDYDIEQVEQTTLPVSQFAISEEVPSFRYVNEDKLTDLTDAFSDIRLSRYHTFSVTQTDREDAALPTVLFFHGSYFNRNIGLFNFAFGQDCSVHNYLNVLDLDYFFNIFQPDCVILESAEYATNSYYFDLYEMEEKTLNAPLESCDLSLADTVTIVDGAAEELPDLYYEQGDGSRLVNMTASLEAGYSFGYYISGGYTYDVEIIADVVSLTADVQNPDLRNGTLYLFT